MWGAGGDKGRSQQVIALPHFSSPNAPIPLVLEVAEVVGKPASKPVKQV